MTFEEVMLELKAMGTAQNRKVYGRHGAGENLFGVSFANLRKLQKTIKKDHELALILWKSGNVDARTLATMIIDPEKVDSLLLEQMIRDIDYYMLVDLFAGNVAAKSSFAHIKLDDWIRSKDEWTGRAGWMILSNLAMKDKEIPDEKYRSYLKTIEKDIHRAKNRTKDAMNNALIAIGLRNDPLEKIAIAAAKKIGKVEVDHGQTNCKTPDAIEYIKRAKARKKTNK